MSAEQEWKGQAFYFTDSEKENMQHTLNSLFKWFFKNLYISCITAFHQAVNLLCNVFLYHLLLFCDCT